ncbi:hypothetical protein M8C21_018384 [Ambrosia artemisiifolia]|uniref:Uncharacterized protein n=1 Tax=Ambrosia artemisiifolia TaxID=4212 RepID=A0AAD5CVL5_AMBAR|nr:hypothetical protein M8C21_018384 [Ambrosia artemisiifolia]
MSSIRSQRSIYKYNRCPCPSVHPNALGALLVLNLYKSTGMQIEKLKHQRLFGYLNLRLSKGGEELAALVTVKYIDLSPNRFLVN